MIRRPPRSTRTDTLFPSRRSSDRLQQLFHHRLQTPRPDILDLGVHLRGDAGDRGDAVLAELQRHLLGPQKRLILTDQRGFSRSEEHTSELQSLMRISYAVFCLTKKNGTFCFCTACGGEETEWCFDRCSII